MLKVEKLSVWYGRQQVLHDVSLEVASGECVAMVGSNGAGKTTLARTMLGVGGKARGHVWMGDQDLLRLKPHLIAGFGLGIVPERGGTFGRMTVLENLKLSMEFAGSKSEHRDETLEWCYTLFPRLEERLSQKAATLSGGERRMLLISRALLAGAKIMVMDEPSLGLSPQLTAEVIHQVIPRLIERGLGVLLIEQNARQALSIADRGYVLESGQVVLEGSGRELLHSDLVRAAYLGV